MLMRGGTSKGAYFLAEDLPADPAERDDLLLRIMGSPDARQIDGIGGAHPLTSKVAVISRSTRADADLDYLFLQVGVDTATVSDRQNCGNLLAGVGPFAVERGLVAKAPVRIHTVNSGSVATATFPGADGIVEADGQTAIAGVPGTAAAIVLAFDQTEGSATGALLPTGNVRDVIDGVTVTCVDNGMPVVVVAASELGRTGYETVAELEADAELGVRVQALRLAAGELMGLGDVSGTSVPKISLVAAPAGGGTICTRTFIPVRVHESIGVLGAVSLATALLLDGAAGGGLAAVAPGQTRFDIEHPTGHLEVVAADVVPSGEFVRDVLGGRVTEQIMLDDGTISGQWLHFTNKGYDLVYTRDWTGSTGRLHHIAFAPDSREDVLRAADICLDRGVFIETGPHKHAIQQTFFLYVYEPGGNRIELCNPAARLVLAPDWRTITWTEAERAKGQAWGLKTIESFHTHGTPPVS
jgi:4-oxalomesaconate tautomerase